jgi:DNA-binding GntR family transcriptional regulator
LDGVLRPGKKVSLDQLKSSYGVSLSPLREALSRLVGVGLVVVEDQRGYRIAPVSVANLRAVSSVRIAIETQALGLSIQRADIEWESKVLGALHTLERASDTARWHAAHETFHRLLFSGGDMPVLQNLCAMMFDLSQRYHRLFLAPDIVDMTDHEAIAKAAIGRDPVAAANMLRAHIEQGSTAVADRLSAATGRSELDAPT